MNEEIKVAPSQKTELDYLRQIEKHLSVIRQIVVFVVIISAVVAVMQVCVVLAGLMGVQLY